MRQRQQQVVHQVCARVARPVMRLALPRAQMLDDEVHRHADRQQPRLAVAQEDGRAAIGRREEGERVGADGGDGGVAVGVRREARVPP